MLSFVVCHRPARRLLVPASIARLLWPSLRLREDGPSAALSTGQTALKRFGGRAWQRAPGLRGHRPPRRSSSGAVWTAPKCSSILAVVAPGLSDARRIAQFARQRSRSPAHREWRSSSALGMRSMARPSLPPVTQGAKRPIALARSAESLWSTVAAGADGLSAARSTCFNGTARFMALLKRLAVGQTPSWPEPRTEPGLPRTLTSLFTRTTLAAWPPRAPRPRRS
jgi:hypothetical protein